MIMESTDSQKKFVSDETETKVLIEELTTEAGFLGLSGDTLKKYVGDALRELRIANRESAKRLAHDKEMREREFKEKLASQEKLEQEKLALETKRKKNLLWKNKNWYHKKGSSRNDSP